MTRFKYGMLSPLLALFVAVVGFPLLYALYLSATDYKLTDRRAPHFVGVTNYVNTLTNADFWQAFGTTASYVLVAVLLELVIGLVLASAFSAILVYAQDLLPGRIGAVSGLFFGFAFGMGGIGAAVLGVVADRWGIDTVYAGCAWLPLLGILTVLLPDLHPQKSAGDGEAESLQPAMAAD